MRKQKLSRFQKSRQRENLLALLLSFAESRGLGTGFLIVNCLGAVLDKDSKLSGRKMLDRDVHKLIASLVLCES